MISIQALVLSIIIALFGGTFLGYKLTVGQVTKLESKLAQVEQVGKLATAEYFRKEANLRSEMAQISENAKVQFDTAKKSLESFKATHTQLLSRKNKQIADLQLLITGREATLNSLKDSLASAKDEVEKAQIRAKILEEEKLIAESKLRSKGLECLSTPIPEEYVTNLNAS